MMLERAAELQARAPLRAREEGLTLSELESVAAEAGLDPRYIRQAATELDEPGPAFLNKSASTSATHNYVERTVTGTLDPEAWDDVVAELRHRFDSAYGASMGMPGYGTGTTEQIGRSVEWRHTSVYGVETRVLIRPRGEQLRIRLSQRVGLAGPVTESILYGGILGGLIAGIAGGTTNSALIGFTTLAVVLAAIIPLILYADRTWRRKKHRELDELADTIVSILGRQEVSGPEAQTLTYEDATAIEDTPVIDDAVPLDPSEEKVPGVPASQRRTKER